MFTDIVGYTALGQRDESLSLAVVEAQQKLVRPVIARHEGREVKTIGDAFLVEFSSAIEAVRCAYDIQRSVREFNLALESGKRLHLRVGIHLGEVVEKDGDILGDAVNVASRVQTFAEDGGVCLTQQVYDQVHNKLELPLASIGRKSLKNVNAPLEIYKMVMPWADGKTTPSTQLDKKRIAVLPLLNMSADPEDQYFADGMTEELISTLSRLKGLTVIARTSVMRYKGTSLPIGEICRELKAGLGARRKRTKVGEQGEDYGAAHRRQDRWESVVSDLRQRLEGRLRHTERDSPTGRGLAEGASSHDREGEPRDLADTKHRGPHPVPEGALLLERKNQGCE